jgi:cellulose synthase (UDP-forming)
MGLTDGEFIAVFDCDHVPTRAFLQMTMGWMVREPQLAFIQTPHHFYSPDPFQRNLAAGTYVPAEGNLFYGLVQDGNDFWDAAFFCGSCAVLRRAALDSVGGFAVNTVTEDAHTAIRMHRAGWHSAYLRLPLAAGLATERLILHIGQRMRWARGMIQVLRLDNPMFGPGLSIGQRICYLNATIHFLFALPRVVFLTAPLAFLLFDENIIAASPLAIIAYALPHIFHSVATNARIQGTWRHSFWSEIYETVLACFLVRLTLTTLLNPRRGRFNVTDKGGLLNYGYFDLRAVYPNIIMVGLLLFGVGRGLFDLLLEQTTTLEFQALLLNSIWATFSLLIILAALAVGRETRQVRNRARVRVQLPAVIWLPDGRTTQGTCQDLSLGGGAVRVERPDGIADDDAIEIEFNLGGERLILPGQIQGWDRQTLQVSWDLSAIETERAAVQLVFGRADAWLDWNNYQRDRPLVSLWRVLVSIKGLFRPRGRLLASAELAAETAVAPAGSLTLAQQSLVLQPRPWSRIAGLVLAAVLLGIPLLAAAQPIPPPPQITLPPSTSPATPPNAAAPPPALASPAPIPLPSATTAATQPATETRTIVYTLRELGANGPMTMRGTAAIQGLQFGVRNDEVVTDARLSVSGAFSTSLLPEYSNITVTLNEQYAGTIPVSANRAEFGPLEIPINPVFFQDRNRLNFRFTGRYTQECNDPLSGLLWSTLSDTSTLTLTVARLPPQRTLARLPLPLFDEDLRQKLVLPFVLSANPGPETLQAAAIVASWFGRLSDYRGASFPVSTDLPSEGNAVLVAMGRDAVAGLGMPPLSGPTIAEVANPNDPLSSVLVVAGRNAVEVIAAANVLSLGSRTLGGERAVVQPPSLPVHRLDDAPAWIPTDRKVRLGELVDASALQGTGYVPGTFHVPFRVAPDLYTWRHRPYAASIRFRAPPGPIIDVAASRLDISMNGIYLRSYSLAPTESTYAWVMRQFGYVQPVRENDTPIPVYTVYGDNDLELYFDARPLQRGDCTAIPQDIHLSVDPDSTLDLTSAYHFTTLPNLAFFVSSGFPFTRYADLSETAVVLPERPTALELSAFLDLMGYLGSLTFQPVNRVTVLSPQDLATVPDKDLLLVGTLAHLSAAASLLERSPYRIESNALQVALPNPLEDIYHLFNNPQSEDRRRLSTVLSAPLPDGAAVLLGAASPYRGRSVVALLAGAPQGLDAMVSAMRDDKLVPSIQGDLALLSGGNITSYRAGATYTVGYLPFWLWPEWMMQDQPVSIGLIMLAAAAVLGVCLYRLLRWKARRRVARRRAPQG